MENRVQYTCICVHAERGIDVRKYDFTHTEGNYGTQMYYLLVWM